MVSLISLMLTGFIMKARNPAFLAASSPILSFYPGITSMVGSNRASSTFLAPLLILGSR
jgi:hypothetical protein